MIKATGGSKLNDSPQCLSNVRQFEKIFSNRGKVNVQGLVFIWYQPLQGKWETLLSETDEFEYSFHDDIRSTVQKRCDLYSQNVIKHSRLQTLKHYSGRKSTILLKETKFYETVPLQRELQKFYGLLF